MPNTIHEGFALPHLPLPMGATVACPSREVPSWYRTRATNASDGFASCFTLPRKSRVWMVNVEATPAVAKDIAEPITNDREPHVTAG